MITKIKIVGETIKTIRDEENVLVVEADSLNPVITLIIGERHYMLSGCNLYSFDMVEGEMVNVEKLK